MDTAAANQTGWNGDRSTDTGSLGVQASTRGSTGRLQRRHLVARPACFKMDAADTEGF